MPRLGASRGAKTLGNEVLHHPVITRQHIVHRRRELMISVQSVVYLDDCGVGSGGEARGVGAVCTVQREILQERAAGEVNDDARGGGH